MTSPHITPPTAPSPALQTAPIAAIIGGGPAGLAAAEILAATGCAVTVIEQMPSLGRKLLMAGRGGLNLSNSEPPERMVARYGDAASWLAPALARFTSADMIAWMTGLGQECFTGSSGRIFPRAMKASPMLRAWLARLAGLGVTTRLRTRWTRWDDAGALRLEGPQGEETLAADLVVLACGGGSWARLGSNGAWVTPLSARGIALAPLEPANCGFATGWSEAFRTRFAGTPIKPIALSHDGVTVRGEAVVTERGIEGGPFYRLSNRLRPRLRTDGQAYVTLDLRPDIDVATLTTKLAAVRPRESLSNRLRKALRLPPVAVALLHESGVVPTAPEALAKRLKSLPVKLVATDAIDRAISTAGGIRQDGLDARFMLRALPGVFACGEMLDWEAPTGGYLLHACLATGRAAGEGAQDWLREQRRSSGNGPLRDSDSALYLAEP